MQPPPTALDSSATLPSLFACLPTAFASPRPPPALLDILSPVLKQRVQLLSESPSTTSWLPLLNWDTQEAAQLPKIVESASLEPHPVSGEIELSSEPEDPKYRRLDEETLQALVNIPETGLAVVYVWATVGDALLWRVAELKPLHGSWQRNATPWEGSIRAADDVFESKTHGPAITTQTYDDAGQDNGEEDDSYWDRYDATPGRTPARTPPIQNQSQQRRAGSSLRPDARSADNDYWGQYGSVQPALDAEDPDEKPDADNMAQSTLNGNIFSGEGSRPAAISVDPAPAQRSMFTPGGSKYESSEADHIARSMFNPNGTHTADSGVAFGLQAYLGSHANAFSQEDESFEHIAHPRPRSRSANSASSGKSAIVEHLEDQADSQGQPQDRRKNSVVAEVAIQQHISTSMKSLFRLARAGGMQRAEFERIVQGELDVLGLLDQD